MSGNAMEEAHKKLVATSRRDATNEAGLIWALLAVLIFSAALFSDAATLFWNWHIHPYVFSAVVGISIAGLIAKIHLVQARCEIARAKALCNEDMKQTKARLQRQLLATLKKRTKGKSPAKED